MSEAKNLIDFFKKQTTSLDSLEGQVYHFYRSPGLYNGCEMQHQLEKVLEKYNFYLLKGVELWYV
jgi:hypothetical protein